MFVKLAVIACALAVCGAAYSGPLAGGLPAAQYPAGVSPQACPNYPNCANPAVAVSPNALPQQYAAQPQYQQPQYQQPAPQQYQQPQFSPVSQYNPVYSQQYNPAPQAAQQQYAPDVQNALDRGEYIGDGDYHGEGLAEALAPGYNAPAVPAYNQAPQYNPAAYQAAPAQAYQAPAGVGQPAQIPAGVDARACPNYPYCH